MKLLNLFKTTKNTPRGVDAIIEPIARVIAELDGFIDANNDGIDDRLQQVKSINDEIGSMKAEQGRAADMRARFSGLINGVKIAA